MPPPSAAPLERRLAELQQQIDDVRAGRVQPLTPAQAIEGMREVYALASSLADALGLAEDALPFVAELVEVSAAERAWRGAIERALGSQRLRILVPPQAIDQALAWVNQRHNRLHVRLLEVRAPTQPPQFWADGFAAKLQLKPHAHQAALRQLLAELDRHCVDSPEALRDTPHAMTAQGLMSGRALQFDKQDQPAHRELDGYLQSRT